MFQSKKGVGGDFPVELVDSADTGSFKVDPTLATGDVKVKTGYAAAVNIGTLPTKEPAGSSTLKVILTNAENDAYEVEVQFKDVAGGEWDDLTIIILNTDVNVDDIVRSTTPANTLDVTATGAAGIDWGNVENPTTAVDLSATDFQLVDIATALGAAGQQDIAQLINTRDTWFVNKGGNDANSGTSWDDAFLTVGQAVSSLAAGDLTNIGPGTYDEAVDSSAVDNLEFVGAGLQTHIQTTIKNAFKVGNGTIVRNLKTESTHVIGIGFEPAAKDDVYAENVTMIGAADGMSASGNRLRLHNCYVFSTFDAFASGGAKDFLFTNTVFETDGTWGTAVDIRALFVGDDGSGILRDCVLIARRNDISANAAVAFALRGPEGQYLLQNVLLIAEHQNASATGVVGAVADAEGDGSNGEINLVGCHVFTSQAGSGAEYHLNQASGVLAVDVATLYDTAKTNGTITVLSSPGVIAALEDAGQVLVTTTIATLASQISFTLTAGSVDDDAYNECIIIIEDATTAAQKAVAAVENYAGGTKTITLRDDPGIFAMAASDKVSIVPLHTVEIAKALLDRANTGALHNITNSVGRQIRQAVESAVIDSGTAQGSGTGNNQIQLATSASSVDGAYDPAMVVIVDNTGSMQSRLIYQYEGSTRMATVDRDWKVLPDATSEYLILAHAGREHVNEGLAQAGAAGAITLNTLASGDNDAYRGQTVFIRSGTGQDQTRLVTTYNGTTKVATVERNWDVTPDTTSGYVMIPWDGGLPLIGITSLAEWLGLIAGKQAGDATALTEIKATGAGSGTYDPTTDSNEAGRDSIGAAGAGLTDLGGMSTGMKAEVNAEVDSALDTAVPGSPTADSVNERMVALDDGTAPPIGTSGSVSDVAPAVGDFDGNAGLSSTNNFYNGAFLVFTSGTLKGIGRQITSYNGTTKNLTFSGAVGDADEPFPVAPANGDTFIIMGRFGA